MCVCVCVCVSQVAHAMMGHPITHIYTLSLSPSLPLLFLFIVCACNEAVDTPLIITIIIIYIKTCI